MNFLFTLHAESALVCSLFGFFLAALVKKRRLLLILPVLFLMMFVADVARTCFSWQGTGLWLLHVGSSTLLGVAFGRGWNQTTLRQKIIMTTFLVFWLFVDLIIQIKSSSAVYYFNHILGFWPGPIYDRSVTFGWNHFFFRLETVLIAAIFFYTPQLRTSVFLVLNVALIGFHLVLGPGLQWRQTPNNIRSTLSESVQIKDLTLHLPPNLDDGEKTVLVNQAQFHWTDLKKKMNISDTVPTHIYVYSNYWQKDSLLGAKYTQYVPVWLSRNEVHLSQESFSETLRHEMVHVLAKPYGIPVLNASLSGAMIEGLAVALSPNTSAEFTIDELVNAADLPNAEILEQLFSLKGFYTSRGSVSYAVAGSFIRFLIKNYGIEPVMESYARANIEVQLGQNWAELTQAWQNYIKQLPRNRSMENQAQRLFSRLSAIEMHCPHVMTPEAYYYDFGLYLRKVGQRKQALKAFQKSKTEVGWRQWTQLAPEVMTPTEIAQKVWFPERMDSLRRVFYLFKIATVNNDTENQRRLLGDLQHGERGKALANQLDSLLKSGEWKRQLEFEFRKIDLADLTDQELNSSGFVREWLPRMEKKPPNPSVFAKIEDRITPNCWQTEELLVLIKLSLSLGLEDSALLYLSDLKTRKRTPRQQERYQGFLSWHDFLQANPS